MKDLYDAGNFLMLAESGLSPAHAEVLARQWRAKCEDIERMRGALTKLAELGEQGMEPSYSEWLTFHDKVAQVARDALRTPARTSAQQGPATDGR